jgi:hypothetical protein
MPNFIKIQLVVLEMNVQSDKQTNKQTNKHDFPLCSFYTLV